MPKLPKSLARGKTDITNLVSTLNARKPGAGDQLSQAITHLNNRLDAQAGYHGTVAVAKQAVGAGLDLDGNRLTGVADPTQGSDIVNLQFFRRHETCDVFRERFFECLKLPTIEEAISGPSPETFPPAGFKLFADTPQQLVYYVRDVRAGGRTDNEKAGAIGVIDVSDKHNPVRIGYLVLSRHAAPLDFAVDEPRLIAFVVRVITSTPGNFDDYTLVAVDLSDPTDPTIIGTAPFVDDIDYITAKQIRLGNKQTGENTTFGYLSTHGVLSQGGISTPSNPFWQNTLFFMEAWNLTNPEGPTGMSMVSRYLLGGYHNTENTADGHQIIMPITGQFVDGLHYPFAMDERGIGTHAVNVSAGDFNFNFTPQSPIYLNHWDVSNPANMRFLGRVQLGLAVPLSGNFSLRQVAGVVMWGNNAFALVTIDDPEIGPLPLVHAFGIDCSEDTPVIKTDMVGPCGEFGNMAVYGDCLYLHAAGTDVLYNVSDISNWQLIGGCTHLLVGFADYRPGHVYQITEFAEPDPDPTKPAHGFSITYFGENGIVCP